MRENESKPMRTLSQERPNFGFRNGEWLTFAEEVSFDADELNPMNIYQSLRLDGPGPGVDIEIDHFELKLPPQSTFAPENGTCFDLVPGNNDADAVMYNPFPFRSRTDDDVLVQVRYDDAGLFYYFAVSGRSDSYDGLSWDVATGCVQLDAVYR